MDPGGYEKNKERTIEVGGGLGGGHFKANYGVKDGEKCNHPDMIKANVEKVRANVHQDKIDKKVAINGIGGGLIGGAAGGGIGALIGGVLGLAIPIVGPPIGIVVGSGIGAAIGGSGAGGIAIIATHEKEEWAAKKKQQKHE